MRPLIFHNGCRYVSPPTGLRGDPGGRPPGTSKAITAAATCHHPTVLRGIPGVVPPGPAPPAYAHYYGSRYGAAHFDGPPILSVPQRRVAGMTPGRHYGTCEHCRGVAAGRSPVHGRRAGPDAR